MRLSKKGQLGLLISFIMAIVVVSVILVVLFRVNAATMTSSGVGNLTTDTTGIYNSSQYIIEAGDQVGSNLSLIAIITVFAIIIGLLTTYFIGRTMSRV